MRRLSLSVVAPVLVGALLLAGCTSGSVGSGIAAFSVDGHEVSQRSFDEELEILAENPELKKVIEQPDSQGQAGVLSRSGGTISSDLAAGWLSQTIALETVARARAKEHVDVTQADRAKGEALARQNVGGTAVLRSLPGFFRTRIIERWTNVAALQRRLVTSSMDQVVQALRAQCPSGRYVNHILVATQAEAQAIAAELAAGADFAQLAQQRSTDGSAAQGGALGCADGQQFAEPFATVAATQPVNVVSAPVQTEFGFHLILVTDTPPAAELDRVTLDAVLGGARQADVEVDPRYGRWDRGTGRVVPPGQ